MDCLRTPWQYIYEILVSEAKRGKQGLKELGSKNEAGGIDHADEYRPFEDSQS